MKRISGIGLLGCCGLLVCLAACKGNVRPDENPDAPALLIRGLVIENHTQAFISAARLLIPRTGRFVSCGNIAPGANCATSFPEQRYSGNPVEVSWSQAGHDWKTGALKLDPDEAVSEAGEALVRVVIQGPNLAAVELVPGP